MSRAISDAWFFRIKAATRDAIVRAGGVVRAGEITLASKTEASRWQSVTDEAIIPIPAALALEAEIGMPVITEAMADLQGRRLSEGGWRRLPDAVRARLVAAEETGTLTAACRQGAAWLDSTAAARRKRTAALLPPILMLVIGAIVAWRVISFYAQAYSSLGKF